MPLRSHQDFIGNVEEINCKSFIAGDPTFNSAAWSIKLPHLLSALILPFQILLCCCLSSLCLMEGPYVCKVLLWSCSEVIILFLKERLSSRWDWILAPKAISKGVFWTQCWSMDWFWPPKWILSSLFQLAENPVWPCARVGLIYYSELCIHL